VLVVEALAKVRPLVFHDEEELAQRVPVRTCQPHVRLSSFERFVDVAHDLAGVGLELGELLFNVVLVEVVGKVAVHVRQAKSLRDGGIDDFDGGTSETNAMKHRLASIIAVLLLSFATLCRALWGIWWLEGVREVAEDEARDEVVIL
jgi:hypothetical protein